MFSSFKFQLLHNNFFSLKKYLTQDRTSISVIKKFNYLSIMLNLIGTATQ